MLLYLCFTLVRKAYIYRTSSATYQRIAHRVTVIYGCRPWTRTWDRTIEVLRLPGQISDRAGRLCGSLTFVLFSRIWPIHEFSLSVAPHQRPLYWALQLTNPAEISHSFNSAHRSHRESSGLAAEEETFIRQHTLNSWSTHLQSSSPAAYPEMHCAIRFVWMLGYRYVSFLNVILMPRHWWSLGGVIKGHQGPVRLYSRQREECIEAAERTSDLSRVYDFGALDYDFGTTESSWT